MSTINGITISYVDNTVTASLSTGEYIIATFSVDSQPVDGEALSESNVRINRVMDGLRQNTVRYLKSIPEITELP